MLLILVQLFFPLFSAMRSRDCDHTSQSRSKSKERHTSPSLSSSPLPTHGDEQLDHLVRSILSRTLSKFDGEPSQGQGQRQDQSQTQSRGEHGKSPTHGSQNNELAQLVLGQVAQFAVNRYLKSRKNKAAKNARDARNARAKTSSSVPMPFLFGGGGRPIGSGERERMQRRREAGHSGSYDAPYNAPYDAPYDAPYEAPYEAPYDGNQEIHLTDPLPPEPVPVIPPHSYFPPRDPAPEPKLRRRRRHQNLSGRDRDKDAPDSRPPLVIPPSPEKPLSPPLPRSYTWDSTPTFPPAGTSSRYMSYDRPPSRSPYLYHPNYPLPLHEPYPPQPESRRRRTGPTDPLTPPISPYRPPETPRETPREQQRRRESERDTDREQRRRDREYDKERRQRKGEARPRESGKEREKEKERERDKERERSNRERERISLERSREAALALSIDDFLKQIRKTDDIVYRNLYRPLVDKYDDHRDRDRDRDRDRGRCSCRSIIMQSADLQRSLARSRSSAHAVRDLLEVPLVEDRRRRRRSTVHFASEQTM
ncbi:hypothetical protein F503_06883 [Ophiostoma piceae UAMH 11346]|uniref:Uncharacterized protein n=1 Tax=Ophiostoma piceae (strain UAMH 11346) TaxID=1262450 RepID=S3C8E0_OPHP1|nr:hypothetical protein F503_06883 [Ophiostoma piceae UAMH 11346]